MKQSELILNNENFELIFPIQLKILKQKYKIYESNIKYNESNHNAC